MIINDIIIFLNELAPPSFQESYDNSGLLIGSPEWEVKSILITLDCTEEVIQEAITNNCNFIITHHPVIFSPLKKITASTSIERTIIKAIKADIAIFAIHTNLDNVLNGVNGKIAEKMALKNCRILLSKRGILSKLIIYIPSNSLKQVSEAVFQAGAGFIGNYSECSFTMSGTGTFKPNNIAKPAIGKEGVLEKVSESRLEVIFPDHKEKEIIKALKAIHPYEEPAFDIISINNDHPQMGAGLIGELPFPMKEIDFLYYLKEKMEITLIRHTKISDKTIENVALCGGSGSFLLPMAIQQKANAFISADFKYHEFFSAENKILIADINHYESEVFTKDLIYENLRKKFANIALVLSNVKTNPISYL